MRDRRLFLVAIGITLLVVLVLSQVTVSPTALAKGGPGGPPAKIGPSAKIVWSQRPVTATVAPGSSFSTTVTFTSTVDLTNVTLRLTPSLMGTTTVTPSTFTTITAGVPYSVEIDVAIPANTMRSAYNGTLTVRKGNRAFALPLPLQFTVQR